MARVTNLTGENTALQNLSRTKVIEENDKGEAVSHSIDTGAALYPHQQFLLEYLCAYVLHRGWRKKREREGARKLCLEAWYVAFLPSHPLEMRARNGTEPSGKSKTEER